MLGAFARRVATSSKSLLHLRRSLRFVLPCYHVVFNSQDGYPESEALRGGLNSLAASITSALWGGSRRADVGLVVWLIYSLVVFC